MQYPDPSVMVNMLSAEIASKPLSHSQAELSSSQGVKKSPLNMAWEKDGTLSKPRIQNNPGKHKFRAKRNLMKQRRRSAKLCPGDA